MSSHQSAKTAVKSQSLSEGQIKQTVNFLNHAFKDACEKYKQNSGDNKNPKGSFLYLSQTEFAYIINEIQKGPIFFAIQNIATANEQIARVAEQLTKPDTNQA